MGWLRIIVGFCWGIGLWRWSGGVLGFAGQCVYVLPIQDIRADAVFFGVKCPHIVQNCNFDKLEKVWYTYYTGRPGRPEGTAGRPLQ